jgi:hypothetical protein
MYGMRRADRAMLAKAREDRRHVPSEIRAVRAAHLAEVEAARQEAIRLDALERQSPADDAARILVNGLSGEDLARLTTLLPRASVSTVLETIDRLSR